MPQPILIIGKLPPPIGGVTIHVQRLLEHLKQHQIAYCFYDLNDFSVRTFIQAIKNHQVIHLHCSSPYLRLLFVLLCRMWKRASLMTVHGDVGRFSHVKNLCDLYAIKYATYPIVINQHSYQKAVPLNQQTRFISAYLPMLNIPSGDTGLFKKMEELKGRTNYICCTNAFHYSLDKKGTEIYGIGSLVTFFRRHPEWGLIISDPSGSYERRLAGLVKESRNILIINRPHVFLNVLQQADCFIRYTSTDGDSLSIHEARDLNVPVIATNVVDRPDDVRLVTRDDFEELEQAIHELLTVPRIVSLATEQENNVIKLYKKVLFPG